MMPPGRQTVTVLTRSDGARDSLGVPAVVEITTDVSGCSVQPLSSTEQLTDTDLVQSHWKLFAPATTVLRSTDSVMVNGLKYEVDGDPMVWNDFMGYPDHMEARLRKPSG